LRAEKFSAMKKEDQFQTQGIFPFLLKLKVPIN